ncbi:DMT family transporter [Sphingomonas sp. DBB INV C78]|uniref:DMT family transporter n=1 Tax=Sphingomonas sp. DBB INV C78 TaxID=3349434 RepID=UPI0036D260C8
MTARPAPADTPIAGILYRIASVIMFGFMWAAMKLAGENGAKAIEMVFYRGLFGLPIVLAWIAAGPGLATIRPRRPMAHVWRSAIGLTSIVLNFTGLIMLPLADATTIGFTAPIFATILSAMLLREHVGPHRWTAVVVGFIGVVVITRPGGSASLPAIGIVVALLGALGTTGVQITLRQLGATESTGSIVFWFFIGCTVAGGIGTAIWGQMHDAATFGLLLIGAGSGAAGQILMTASLRAAPVGTVAPFDYLQILIAIALGWLIWSTAPPLATIAGAALIAGSGLYTAYREHRLRRESVAATPQG